VFNHMSNRFSNVVLSAFAGKRLADTQCGLRRYPLAETLALRVRAGGYAFEAEALLRLVAAGVPIVETRVAVLYPQGRARVTHFRVARDPARIVIAVVRTTLALAFARLPRFVRRILVAALMATVLAILALSGHAALRAATVIRPPEVSLPRDAAILSASGIVRVGHGYRRDHDGMHEVFLEGTPEEMGAQHERLLRDRMIANEQELWNTFTTFVPLAPVRALLMDVSRVRYRHVDQGFPKPRILELAAEAQAFAPDPFASRLETFHRMVFLHSLYDIALSFEHSPLIGCSIMGLGPAATARGHTLIARAFDFEGGEVFDRDKAIFFVKGKGVLPFASVAWPGLVGVMTGMNLEGLFVSVNGARAGEPQAVGMPVIFGLREALETARTTDEAIAVLQRQTVMVSHLVFVGDAHGAFAVVERAPNHEAFVRATWADPSRVALTNHYDGPLAGDAKNQNVRARTSTVARKARADELVRNAPDTSTVRDVVAMLRDKSCVGAGPRACALGDRRAIDALIATHGVVADTTERTLWVSAFPHLSGKFVRFDLRAIFAEDHDPETDAPAETIDEDPVLRDGRYDAARGRGLPIRGFQ
jgi:isopenicillin-N N-acyltransferase like protein